VRQQQESVSLCSQTFPPRMRPYSDTAEGFRQDFVNLLNHRSVCQMFSWARSISTSYLLGANICIVPK
jgi:hypothetical protein